jgi:hypothetical protein
MMRSVTAVARDELKPGPFRQWLNLNLSIKSPELDAGKVAGYHRR